MGKIEEKVIDMYIAGFGNGYDYALKEVKKSFYPVRKWVFWSLVTLMLLQDAAIFYNLVTR
jgi:hypothetical protein